MDNYGYKYCVRFACVDGRKGRYRGDTKEAIHKLIDDDTKLRDWEASSLKYGYFWEFTENDYETKDYVIDNGIHFIWEVATL